MVQGTLAKVLLDAAQAIPHYLFVPAPAEAALEEAAEYAFRSLASILYGFEDEIRANVEVRKQIAVKLFHHFQLNLHKFEHFSIENAAECLAKLLELDDGKPGGVREFMLAGQQVGHDGAPAAPLSFVTSILSMAKLVKDEGLSHTKLFLLRSLTLLLTTANYTDSSLYTFVL